MDRETGEGRMGGCALLLLLVSTLLVQIRASDPLLYEPFDETFEGRWVVSGKDDYKALLVLISKWLSQAKLCLKIIPGRRGRRLRRGKDLSPNLLSGKYDLRLTESSPGSLVCKLKHVKRGAALDIYVSKVVRVNGKALDKAAKVTLIGGDEVIFSSLGRHAYIFQKLPEEKSSASTFSSSCEKSSLAP